MLGQARLSKTVTALAAAGLLWSQDAGAAVTPLSARVDPLVALSALGTADSRAAVCAGSAAATAAASAAAQAAPGGCLLPVTGTAVAAPVEGVAPPPPAMGFPVVPLLVGLAAVVAAAVIISSSHDHGHGNLSPISPF